MTNLTEAEKNRVRRFGPSVRKVVGLLLKMSHQPVEVPKMTGEGRARVLAANQPPTSQPDSNH